MSSDAGPGEGAKLATMATLMLAVLSVSVGYGVVVCTENSIRVDEVTESRKLAG